MLVIQQVVLAFVGAMLCVFLMVRNKQRIMTRTFNRTKYMNIVDGGSEEDNLSAGEKRTDDVRTLELPVIDEVHHVTGELVEVDLP